MINIYVYLCDCLFMISWLYGEKTRGYKFGCKNTDMILFWTPKKEKSTPKKFLIVDF